MATEKTDAQLYLFCSSGTSSGGLSREQPVAKGSTVSGALDQPTILDRRLRTDSSGYRGRSVYTGYLGFVYQDLVRDRARSARGATSVRDSVGVDYSDLRILLLAIPILSRLCLTRELIQAIIGSDIDLIN